MKLLIEVLIFTSVIGVIATTVAGGANLTGASATLFALTTLFVVIGFITYIVRTTKVSKR